MKLFNFFIIGLSLSIISCADTSESTQSTTVNAERTKSQNQVPVRPSKAQMVNNQQSADKMTWLTIEEAAAKNEENPKPLLVDVYTDWCGWCKVMDRKTFTNPEVQKYIKENFYPVKFDAEQRETVDFNGKSWDFVPGGRRGHNQLASFLLNGRLGYPSFAFLNSEYQHLHITVGFKNPDQFLDEMKKAMAQNM